MKKTVIAANGVTISVESDIPDVTASPDNGPNAIALQTDAQKPADATGAEYNAGEHVDDPEDVLKANESTVLGVALMRKNNITSSEAFVKAGFLKAFVFENIEEFFKSKAFQTGLEFAKAYAEKHGLTFAANSEVERWCNDTLPGKAYRVTIRRGKGRIVSAGGVVFAYYSPADYDSVLSKRTLVFVDIFFEKNGKTGAFKIKSFAKIKIGKNVKVAAMGSESTDTGVPDTTQDAGPDTIELHEDAQKPADAAGAEYDAAEHVDTPEDVEKANESTFFGFAMKGKSAESFLGKGKVSYKSSAEFFKSPEVASAIATAKAWGAKKKWTLAPIAAAQEAKGLKEGGFKFVKVGEAALAYLETKGRIEVDIFFKTADGKTAAKAFARIKIDISVPAKKTGTESTNPVDIAFGTL